MTFFVILIAMTTLSLSAGDFNHFPRNPAQVQKPSTKNRKAAFKHIQNIKDDFFFDDSLTLFSSTVNSAANLLEGYSQPRRDRKPIHYHAFDLSHGLLERVENKLFKLAHKPLIKSLTAKEKAKLVKLRDEIRPALVKIVNYDLPEGEITESQSAYSGTIPRVFKTHLNSSAIPGFERKRKTLERSNLGDFNSRERKLIDAASDFNDLKSEDLREALEIPLGQLKGLAHKVWFKLNKVLGETNSHNVVKELERTDSDESILSNIKSMLQSTLRGRVDVNSAKKNIEGLYQDLKQTSFKALTYSRAKIIAALKFSRIFLQNEKEQEALPESILVRGDNHKMFNISRKEDLPEIDRIGGLIKSRLHHQPLAA